MRRTEVFGYLAVLALAAAGVVRLVLIDSGPLALGLLVLGAALFLVYFFRAERKVQGFLGRRSTREGGSVLGTTLFLAGIAVLVNVLAVHLDVRLDTTEDRLFTLAPETESVLRGLETPAEVWVFYPEDSPVSVRLESLLEAARAVDPRLAYHVVDPGRDPLKAMEFGLREFSTVVQVEEKHEVFTGAEEEDLLAALVTASTRRTPYVGFLKGHGEAEVVSTGPAGMRTVAEALHRRGYSPFSLNLLSGGAVSESLDVVVAAGPRNPLTGEEPDSLRAFLESGGRMLVLLDPSSPVTMDSILHRFGVRFDPRFLADPEQLRPQVIVPSEMSAHPVVGLLSRRRVQVVLPGVGEISTDPRDGVRQATLLRSGRLTRLAGDETDPPRRRALAAAVEWGTRAGGRGRMVVVGDADFATNEHSGSLANTDFFLAAVQWLAEQESRIALTPRTRTSRPVVLSRQQGRALMVLVVGLLPLGVLITGSVVWWRRR